MRKLIACFITFYFILSSVTVLSSPSDTVVITRENEQEVLGVDGKLESLLIYMAELKRYSASASQTAEFMLYELTLVTNLYKQLYYLTGMSPGLKIGSLSFGNSGMADSEVMEMSNEVRVMANAFVSKYGIDLVQHPLLYDAENRAGLRNQLAAILGEIIPDLVLEELEPVLEATAANPSDSLVVRHGELLYWSGEVLSSLQEFERDFSDIRNQNRDIPKSLWDIVLEFFSVPTSYLQGRLRDLDRDRLNDLIEEARNVRVGASHSGGYANVETGILEPIEALVTVKRKNNAKEHDYSIRAWEKIQGANEIQLRSAYIAMLAATSVYTPFRSHVGDTDYIEALKSLSAANEEDKLVSLFSYIKDKRKPLYYINRVEIGDRSVYGTMSNKDVSGRVVRATLGDLVRFSANEDNTAFLTVRGQFSSGSDMNSWAFYQVPSSITDADGNTTSSSSKDEIVNLPADRTISGDVFTKTLFEMGSSPGMWSAGLMVFNNSYHDLRSTSLLDARQNSLLYMNVFGDIVLSDNTVIIPGAANPIIYNTQTAYNPYTVAFMNSYPRVAQDVSTLRIQSKTDENKYMLLVDKSVLGNVLSLFIQAFSSNNIKYTKNDMRMNEVAEDSGTDAFSFHYSVLEIRKIQAVESRASFHQRQGISVFPFFYGGADQQTGNFYSFLRLSGTDNINTFDVANLTDTQKHTPPDRVAVTFEQSLTGESYTIFPYSPDENFREERQKYFVPQLIAQNMYWYYMYDDNFELGTTPNNNLRTDYLFENVIVEMLQGTAHASAYEKNIDITEFLMGDGRSSADGFTGSLVRELYKSVCEMDGVLGMASADSDPIFGQVLKVAREHSLIVFVFFAALFIFRYIKRGDLLYVVSMTALSGMFLYLFVFILPTHLPTLYNAAGGMFTEGLVANTVLYKAEKYSTTYGSAVELNDRNDYDMQTLSITVYKMSEAELRRFAEDTRIPYNTFRYGSRVVLDSNVGLFIQGDSLKVNVDVLLANNPISGDYVRKDSVYKYQLKGEKMTSSSLDFYFPYYQIEDGFIETLNALLSTYNIPRTTANYIDGLIKDSYIAFNYTNSIPFLYPDRFTEVSGLTPVELFKLERAFPNPHDFLRLSEWINDPPEEMHYSRWYRIMLKNGFYDAELGPERRSKLISYVNYHTKRFLIENQPIIGIVSDENLIKVTSLQASFFFNSYISDFGAWAYPWGYNQEELKLSDVFLTALTTNEERFVKHNFDIVTFVANVYGTFGLWCLFVILFFAMLFTVVMKFSMPLLYILLGVFVVYRMLADKPVGSVLRGYFKTTFAVIGLYTSFIIITAGVPHVLGGMTMLVSLAVINILLFILATIILYGFLRDLRSLGDSGIGESLKTNPLTRWAATPVSRAYTSVASHWNSSPAYSAAVNVEQGGDPGRTNRSFILRSMEGRRQSSYTPREPHVTYTRSTEE